MGRAVRLLVAAVAVAVVAAGCGGDSGEKTSSTTVASAPTDPRGRGQLNTDRAAAENAVLRLSDLPSGWTGEADTDDSVPEVDAARVRFADCLGLDRGLIGARARAGASASSDDFEDGTNLQVQNRVTVLPTPERAREQLAALKQPSAGGCFETFVNAAIELVVGNPGPGRTSPPGVSFGRAQVEGGSLAGLHADSVAYRAKLPVTKESQTVDALFDVVLAVKGRAAISMFFIGIGRAFPADLEASLTNAVIDRAPEG